MISLKKSPNVATTASTSGAVALNSTSSAPMQNVVPKKVVKQTPDEIRTIISDGLKYEEQIGFSNLDVFKDVSPEARKKVLNHFNFPIDKERFLNFASGSTPGLLEHPYSDDIFDALRSNAVRVIESFSDEAGTLILNKKEAEKIIAANKTLFAKRLGLSETASVKEIFDVIDKTSNSPLADPKRFSDLKQLLIGTSHKNATYSQILQDITNAEKRKRHGVGFVSFYRKSANSLDDFKQALRDGLNSPNSSYSNMTSEFKDDLLKMIDSITPEEYANRLSREANLFQDTAFVTQRYNNSQKLANKLENARLHGTNIGFD